MLNSQIMLQTLLFIPGLTSSFIIILFLTARVGAGVGAGVGGEVGGAVTGASVTGASETGEPVCAALLAITAATTRNLNIMSTRCRDYVLRCCERHFLYLVYDTVFPTI